MNLLSLLALLAIPACSEINHLGGQSTTIPNPRITCRVILMPLVIFVLTCLIGSRLNRRRFFGHSRRAVFALWAVFKWGPMFMSINGTDCRDYTTKMVSNQYLYNEIM